MSFVQIPQIVPQVQVSVQTSPQVPVQTSPPVLQVSPQVPVQTSPQVSETQSSPNNIVSAETFEPARVYGGGREEKKVTTPKGDQTYYQIPLSYNFGTTENPRYGPFLMECPELRSMIGIQSQDPEARKNGGMSSGTENKRKEHSIMVKFDISDPNQTKFLNAMTKLHAASAHIADRQKGMMRFAHFDPETAIKNGAGFKYPYYVPIDTTTCKPIAGAAPSMFLKLYHYTLGKTLFTDPSGREIDWDLLRSVEMKFIPLIQIDRIYCGGQGPVMSIQMRLISAIITDIKPCNTETQQQATLARLQSSMPNINQMVKGQLENILQRKKRNEDAPSYAEAVQGSSAAAQSSQPTLSPMSSMPMPYPTQANTVVPSFPGGNTTTMQHFA